MKYIVQFARVAVGLLFIFSGFIKANDPKGFSYKLNEYFEVFAKEFHPFFENFIPYSLAIAIFIVALEMLQGFMLLSGSRAKINSWLLLALIVFFTFLTFYSAYTGKIKECGCFGDAIPLKAWQSFYKDLILLVLIVIIVIGHKHIKPIFKNLKFDNVLVGIFAIICAAIPLYANAYQPYIDFSEFKPGNNLIEMRKKYDEAQKKKLGELKFIYKNNTTGAIKELTTDELSKIGTVDTTFFTTHSYVDRKEPKKDTTVVELLPTVVAIDFLDKDKTNYADQILGNPNYQFVVVALDYEIAAPRMEALKAFAAAAEKDSVAFCGLTYSDWPVIEDLRHKNQHAFDFYKASDDTPLKIATRANPGLILLKGGVVIKKWPWRSFPSYESVKENYLK